MGLHPFNISLKSTAAPLPFQPVTMAVAGHWGARSDPLRPLALLMLALLVLDPGRAQPEGSTVAGEGGGEEEKRSSQVYLSPIEYTYFEGVAVDEAAYASHNSTGLPPFPVMASRPTAANPLLFIHVPKTAGTVVRRALASVVVPTPVPGADGREKRGE
jgi:hypothetical protein